MLKRHKKLMITLLVLFCVYAADFILVSYDKRPIFVVQTSMTKDGGTIQYYGLGYKVIGWNKITTKQVDGKEVYGRLTGYEISVFPFFQDINEGPKKDLRFTYGD